jgi:hypothetical protein
VLNAELVVAEQLLHCDPEASNFDRGFWAIADIG